MGRATRKAKAPTGKQSFGQGEKCEKSLFEGMGIASTVHAMDTNAMSRILQEVLPGRNEINVKDVVISKSVGEFFTGGRSTPVYYITCRVARGDNSSEHKNRNFVVKLVIMPDNDQKDDADIETRRESYAVERRFYDCAAPKLRNNNTCPITIPKLLVSDKDGSKPWPVNCFLMNDLRTSGFPVHPDFMSVEQAQRALKYLAVFHSVFWGDSSNSEWRRHLWDRGGFWNRPGRFNSSKITTTWLSSIKWLEQKYPNTITSEIKYLGQRIQFAVPIISGFLTDAIKMNKCSIGTLIHGDFKAANLFFSDATNLVDPINNGPESVAALDFQFSGFGLGAEDVAYVLYPDARGDYFTDEDLLLRTYHDELIQHLRNQCKGGPSTLPYDKFKNYYDLSRIQLTGYWLGKGWVASTEGEMKLILAIEDIMKRIDGGKVMPDEKHYIDSLVNIFA